MKMTNYEKVLVKMVKRYCGRGYVRRFKEVIKYEGHFNFANFVWDENDGEFRMYYYNTDTTISFPAHNKKFKKVIKNTWQVIVSML